MVIESVVGAIVEKGIKKGARIVAAASDYGKFGLAGSEVFRELHGDLLDELNRWVQFLAAKGITFEQFSEKQLEIASRIATGTIWEYVSEIDRGRARLLAAGLIGIAFEQPPDGSAAWRVIRQIDPPAISLLCHYAARRDTRTLGPPDMGAISAEIGFTPRDLKHDDRRAIEYEHADQLVALRCIVRSFNPRESSSSETQRRLRARSVSSIGDRVSDPVAGMQFDLNITYRITDLGCTVLRVLGPFAAEQQNVGAVPSDA